MLNIPQMRTIDELAKLLKEKDPHTQLTKTAIRQLVVSGDLPCVKVGRKYLVAVETLENFLINGNTSKPVQVGLIRPIPSKL